MRSMLPILRKQARTLRVRLEGAQGTLDLLADLGMSTREHQHTVSYLTLRLNAVSSDIRILEKGYALKGS